MYGLINKAIHEMVCNRFGEETWQEIRDKAGVGVDTFISMEPYPDEMTHELLKAAGLVLGLSASEVMQAFGEFWIQYTATEGYGELMAMSGDTLPEFLHNLDDLHFRIGISFPKLQPPSFTCEEVEGETLHLHYHSQREGLAPMVVGLMKGLGTHLDTKVEIIQTQSKSEGADHDEFMIHYQST